MTAKSMFLSIALASTHAVTLIATFRSNETSLTICLSRVQLPVPCRIS